MKISLQKEHALQRQIEDLKGKIEEYQGIANAWHRAHEVILGDTAKSELLTADALINEYERVKAELDDARRKTSQSVGVQQGLERAIAIIAWESNVRSRTVQQVTLPQSVR